MSNILGGEARTDVMRDNIVRDSLLRVLKEKIQQCRNLQVLELVIDNKQVEQLTRGMLPERIYELRRSGIPWTTISSSLENKCGAHENLVYRRWVALIQYNTNIQSRMKDLYDYGLPDGEITACLFTEVPPHVIERIKIDLEAKTSIDAHPWHRYWRHPSPPPKEPEQACSAHLYRLQGVSPTQPFSRL